MRRREFLKLPAVCLPRSEAEKGRSKCNVLGTRGDGLPYYPLETRIAGAPFSASFEQWSASRKVEWYEGEPAFRSRWSRSPDGSTEVVQSFPLLFRLVCFEVHFVTDVPRSALTGFVSLVGPLARTVAATGLLGERVGDRVLLNGDDPIDQMPLRPGDREDGSPRQSDRPINIGGIAQFSFEQFIEGPTSKDTLEISGRSWPTTKLSFYSPDKRGVIEVWVSEDLSLVLKEDIRLEGELQRSYRAVSLEQGGDIPMPSIPTPRQGDR